MQKYFGNAYRPEEEEYTMSHHRERRKYMDVKMNPNSGPVFHQSINILEVFMRYPTLILFVITLLLAATAVPGAAFNPDHLQKLAETNVCTDCDLTNAVLINASLEDANLAGSNLTGANLIAANMRLANLSETNLTNADLRAVTLNGGYLTGANLTNADFTVSNLSGVDMTGAIIHNTNFSGCKWYDLEYCEHGSIDECIKKKDDE